MAAPWFLFASTLFAAGPAFVEQIVTERVRWPVRRVESNPGACRDLRPDEIRVREAGRDAVVNAFEPRRSETLHVLLIDTSDSMRDRIDSVRRAAQEYIDALPPTEAVWVGSFDDDLFLAGSPTRDRALLRHRLEGLRLGAYTRLWEGLDQTLDVLPSIQGRKALVLLTDGCDSISPRRRGFQQVLQTATRVEDVSLFFVGIDMPRSCQGFSAGIPSPDRPIYRLGRLSHSTGAETFDVKDVAGVGEVYRRIRRMLDREATLYYTPPSQEQEEDRPESVPVRVRSTRDGCRLETARTDRRRISAPVARTSAELSWKTRTDTKWTLSLEDITRDAGLLYALAARDEPPRWRVRPDRTIYRERRELTFDWPPAAEVQQQRADPENWFGAWSDPGAEVDWIHGGKLLDLHHELAAALMSRDDYAVHATKRLHHDWVERTLANLTLAGPEVETIRDVLTGTDREAPAEEHTRYLAAWLGDYSLRETFEELERIRLNRALHGEEGEVKPPDADRWRELFPVATDRRLIAPTRLVYDPVAERFGFFRIRLPFPREARPPIGRLPPRALVYAWFQSLETRFAEDTAIDELEYLTLPRKARRKLRRTTEGVGRDEEDWWAVHIGWHEGEQSAQAHLFYDRLSFSTGIPVCIDRLGFPADGWLPVELKETPDCTIPLPHASAQVGSLRESGAVFPIGRTACVN